MRSFTRGLGLVVGLFALGLLTTYVLLYQPLERRYRTAQADLSQANAALETLRADLKLAQTSLSGSEVERKNAASALKNAETRIDLQRARAKVYEIRLALALKDSVSAKLALTELENIAAAIKAGLPAAGADTLDPVLALVKSDLARDARLADQDLQRFLSELDLIDQGLE